MRSNPRPRARRHEGGAAFVIVLTVLVALTLIGLTLAFTTQTELQIGGAERATNRVFYAADTGISVASARALVAGAYAPVVFNLKDSLAGSPISNQNSVSVSAFYPINDQPCNLCQINNAGDYSSSSYRKINHAVTVVATRLAGPAASTTPTTTIAQKTLTTMMEFQPWQASADAYAAANNPTELANIKF